MSKISNFLETSAPILKTRWHRTVIPLLRTTAHEWILTRWVSVLWWGCLWFPFIVCPVVSVLVLVHWSPTCFRLLGAPRIGRRHLHVTAAERFYWWWSRIRPSWRWTTAAFSIARVSSRVVHVARFAWRHAAWITAIVTTSAGTATTVSVTECVRRATLRRSDAVTILSGRRVSVSRHAARFIRVASLGRLKVTLYVLSYGSLICVTLVVVALGRIVIDSLFIGGSTTFVSSRATVRKQK